MLRMLDGYEPLHDSYDPPRLNDIGNLMLAFTLLWTYMSFAQFLIIWSGNLKQEIPWVQGARLRAVGSGGGGIADPAFLRAVLHTAAASA